MKIIGKVESLYSEDFVGKSGTPFRKYVLIVVYNANFYSHKKDEWYDFPKTICFESISTNYVKKGEEETPYTDKYSHMLFELSQKIEGNELYFIGVDFCLESEKKEIPLRGGGVMIKFDHKLHINSITPMGEVVDEDFLD